MMNSATREGRKASLALGVKALAGFALASLCIAPLYAQTNLERLQSKSAPDAAGAQGVAPDAPVGADGVLRVCADPNNLPLSNEKGDGYENKIAAQMAHDFGWKLDYTYFPQRMGFVRRTLRAKDEKTGRYLCDLIVGVPKNYGMTETTRPYLHSTYAMVFRKGSDLSAKLKSPDDLLKLPPDELHKLRFGIFSQTPAVDWMLRNNLYDQVSSYPIQSGDPQAYPGELIEHDLVGKKIDVAMVWGPIAGYFAKHAGSLDMVAFKPDPTIKFDFEISMGMRRGEKAWQEKVDNWIGNNQKKIDAILLSYDVPLVDKDGHVKVHTD